MAAAGMETSALTPDSRADSAARPSQVAAILRTQGHFPSGRPAGADTPRRLGRQPTISGGHYYLNDHGLIPVTKAAYEHALVLQQRIFTLGPSIFFGLGVLVHYPRRRVGGNAVAHA